jgi:hypothetical protein
VEYRWHPLFGKEVIVARAVTHRDRGPVTMYRLRPEDDRYAREIPEWMLDATACSRMKETPTPRVAWAKLVELKALLARRLGAANGEEVEHRHSETEGGADGEEDSKDRSGAGGSLRDERSRAAVAAAATWSSGARDLVAGQVAAGTPEPADGPRTGDGGSRR